MEYEMFSIGCEVKIALALSEEAGVVAAYDQHTKMLTLKQQPNNQKDSYNNIMNINMRYAKELVVLKEADPNKTKSTIDKKILPKISSLNSKFSEMDKERQNLHELVYREISPDGRKLFISLAKILPQTRWGDNQEIIVMEEVCVKHPYREATVLKKNPAGTKTIEMVERAIQKCYMDEPLETSNTD